MLADIAPTPIANGTLFDTPARTPMEDVRRQAQQLLADRQLLSVTLDGFPDPAFVLDENRQITLSNVSARALVDKLWPGHDGLGERLGEALGCTHAAEGPGGCGTGLACRSCDVLNTAQSVYGAAALMPGSTDADDLQTLAEMVHANSAQLIAEIIAQRDLLQAEQGTLETVFEDASLDAVIQDCVGRYRIGPISVGRQLRLVSEPAGMMVRTVPVLLTRSVSNLIKNALEASAAGTTVQVSCRRDGDDVVIAVHNPDVMPAAVQAKVFQRSFSTKARAGRGLGTYGVRLLVERYLGGTVGFRSTPEEGTTFTIRIPGPITRTH